MTADQMWEKSKLTGEYEAWAFGGAPDELADLVLKGIKTATCSAYDLYELDGESVPETGDISVILNSHDEAVCIIKNTKVYKVAFCDVTADHAYKEGEGDRSLQYWRSVHTDFFKKEFSDNGLEFNENITLLCEEFEVVYG